MKLKVKTRLIAGLIATIVSAGCETSLRREVNESLHAPALTGTQWGLVVADMSGKELIAINPDARFIPASNTKVVTTMAMSHYLQDGAGFGTRLYLRRSESTPHTALILSGGGDGFLNDREDCERSCLAQLADAVVARGISKVDAVIGDASIYADEPWGPGWSVEDLQYFFGAAVSALSLNENFAALALKPGDAVGAPLNVTWTEGKPIYEIENHATTAFADTDAKPRIERLPRSEILRLYGSMPVGAATRILKLAIENPTHYTATRFAALLRARGVSVGQTHTQHRLRNTPENSAHFLVNGEYQTENALEGAELIGEIAAPDKSDAIAHISKNSANLLAELGLRQLGLIAGDGSREAGLEQINLMLKQAGLPEQSYSFADGSGMSVYNRISPRAMVTLLAFAASQPWFDEWIAAQAIAGVDGHLEQRFTGTILEGRLYAKTGTLSGVNALSGVMTAKSGRRLLFSVIANDRPLTVSSALPQMDAALTAIALEF